MKKEIKESLKNVKSKNAVMYTRVGSQEQNGFSLSQQRQVSAIIEYARKHKYKIKGHFGGVYSATDKKEFNNMISYIKESAVPIRYILAEDISRLSKQASEMNSFLTELKTIRIKFKTIDKKQNKLLRNKKRNFGPLDLPMNSHGGALNPNGKVRPKGKAE